MIVQNKIFTSMIEEMESYKEICLYSLKNIMHNIL